MEKTFHCFLRLWTPADPEKELAAKNGQTNIRRKQEWSGENLKNTNMHKTTRRRVARKHFSSRRKSECELSGKCAVRSVKSSELR